ncbi:M4 family metallopeptidase [Pyxidicoccus caerfyrddinensis]|uniref:M4 family metallopeptidase n=1 Tax=Pyxidicoccus caerfyrddinensis TaxID=2709663 RepID=UPI0013DB7B27|nr:M4 family metallopeptidase [Pyxidicoccus caerfyrddinensis]
MNRKSLSRRPSRALRMGAMLLSASVTLGTPHTVGAQATVPGSTTAVDPDAPLRPKLSPSERERLELSLPDQAAQVTAELNAARTRFGLGPDDELRLVQAQLDSYGTAHFRFRQFHRGARVMGRGIVAHRDASGASETPYVASYITVDTTPGIDSAEAQRVAEGVHGPASEPLSTRLELAIQPVVEVRYTPDATGAVRNSEQMHRDVTGYRLVYLAQVAPEEADEPETAPAPAPVGEPPPASPSRAGSAYPLDEEEPDGTSSRLAPESSKLAQAPLMVVIDAATGRVLSQRQDISHADDAVESLGHSLQHGDVTLSTRYNAGANRHEMKDPHRAGNEVRNLKNGTSHKASKTSRYVGSDNEWGDGFEFEDGQDTFSTRGETAAVDVAYGLERTWDMLARVFGRKGLDNKGSSINPRVHYGHEYTDAHWSNQHEIPFFGDGNKCCTAGEDNIAPKTSLEIVAHELGHGVWQYELGATDEQVASGLNEGHGDVMGSLAEFYTLGHDGLGWHIPDTHAGWNFRTRMVNPEGYPEKNGSGEVRHGLRYFSAFIHKEPVHVIGTLYGHAFVLLAHGAVSNPDSTRYSGYLPNGMAGIGADRAGELWYVATTAYLPEEPDFNQLRSAYLSAAKQVYGEGSRVHNAVKDAFGAVAVGQVATDSTPPVIWDTHVSALDEGEGSVFVVASAGDDTGVLRTEFRTGTQQRNSDFAPFEAYLDVSTLSLGSHPVRVKAVDRTLKETDRELPMVLVGANQLLENGNFEAGTAGWFATAGVIGKSGGGRPLPFLGAYNAVFSALGQVTQVVSIPADATSATWSFRVRVERDAQEGGVLAASVRDENTGTLTTLATFDREDVKYFTAGRHYRRAQLDLLPFRGRTLKLGFSTNTLVGDKDYGLDNVSVTYTAPVKVSAPKLVLREDEQTLRFDFVGLSGYAPERIKKVEYLVGGVVKATGLQGPAFPSLISTKGWPTGSSTVVARIYDHANALVAQSAGTTLTLKGVKQALSNGDFEDGTASWLFSGAVSVPVNDENVARAFLGSRHARLGGKGVQHEGYLSQIVGLPQDLLTAQLSFRLAIDTQEDNAGTTDSLLVEAQVLPDGAWQPLQTVTANTDLSGEETFRGYQRRTVNLTTFKGKTVRLRFKVREDAGLPTTFRIDNASVVYTQLGFEA